MNRLQSLENYRHNLLTELDKIDLVAPRRPPKCGLSHRPALDARGLLCDQRLLCDYRLGRSSLNKIGCGAVACYNLLALLGARPSWPLLCYELDRMIMLGGRFGLHLFMLHRLLARRGLVLRYRLALPGEELKAPAGILFYFLPRFKGGHFVAFKQAGRSADGVELLRFFNSQNAPLAPDGRVEQRMAIRIDDRLEQPFEEPDFVPGGVADCRTLEQYLKDLSDKKGRRSPLALALCVELPQPDKT